MDTKPLAGWLRTIARLGLLLGAVALWHSPDLPYWEMKLLAPQYPKGLSVAGYPDRIAGDVKELDGLNHYIGMRPLGEAAQFERQVGLPFVHVTCGLMLLAAAFPSRWTALLLVPAVLFPAAFLADLYYWLREFGLHLDPHAPLSRSIKPFVPTILGEGKVGQFRTSAWAGDGLLLATGAAVASAAFIAVEWLVRRRPEARPAEPVTRELVTAAAALLGVFAVGGPARAATLDVRPDGPLSTIEAAVRRATDGDTIQVHGGTHRGPLTISKRVRLAGVDRPVIDGGGRGTVVTLAAPGIHFEGFVVRGSGDRLANEDGDAGVLATAADVVIADNRLEDVLFGVSLREAANGVVRGNVLRGKPLDIARRGDLIRLWWSHGSTVERNDVADGRDVVLWYSKQLTIRDNTIHRGRYGIHFMYCDGAAVTDNRLIGNSVGTFLMYSRGVRVERNWIEGNRGASGYGVGLKDMGEYAVRDNVIANNRTGVFMETARGEVAGNLIAFNDKGLVLFTSCTRNGIRDNAFQENGEQVAIEGATGADTANAWERNFWSDYRGLDGDRDGFGDRAYRPVKLFERLTDRNAGLKLFAGGPAAEAIDFSSKLFPIFEPQPKFLDPHPRIAPPPPPLTRQAPGSRMSWLALGGLLLAAAAVAVVRWHGPLTLEAVAGGGPAPAAPPVPAPAEPAIRVAGVTKRFGRVAAVDGVSFEVRPGEAVALWGPNGAGKTTLIRCLLGLIPFDGAASVFGKPCGLRGKASRRLLGYVPQEVKLPPDQTVGECVRFFARLRKVSPARGAELLAEWGLGDAIGRPVRHLSGGMRQKLALVLALLSDPPVLLLDEPTNNLDAATREEFGRLLARLKAAGKTLVFCTHRAGEILTLADRVLVLQAGKLAADGSPAELRQRLLRPAVLRLTVLPENRRRAAEVLAGQGFRVRADGGEVWADVPAGRKAEAVAALHQAGVPLVDFEVETDRGFEGD